MGLAINRVINKSIVVIILSFIALIMLITGVSYALFIKEDVNTNNQVIDVGSIDASLTSSTGVLSIRDLSPKAYSDLEPNENTYSFTITNTGSYTLRYEVYFIDNTEVFIDDCINVGDCSGYSEEALEPQYFQYINYKLDSLIDNFDDINESGQKTVLSGTILSGESKTYTMQIWLDTNATNDMIGKTASFNIKLDVVAVDSPIESDSTSFNTGDIVTIGDEEFYVLTASNARVRMISKYNIRVGYDVTESGETLIDESNELYNRQDPESLGPASTNSSNYLYKSVINYTDMEHSLGQGTCSDTACYGSYQGSILEEKIQAYVNYLKDHYGADVIGDAPTETDLLDLETIPNYYKTSFWTKASAGVQKDKLYVVYYDNDANLVVSDALVDKTGVRPIIIVDQENIRRKINRDNTNITVDVTTLDNSQLVTGSIVFIGSETFYVVSNNDGILRLLAKENLYCKYKKMEASYEELMVTVDNIIQQSPTNVYIGLPFSKTSNGNRQGTCLNSSGNSSTCYSSYKNSYIENYVNLYEKALAKKYGVTVRVDLPTMEDLISMDYSELTKTFKYEGYSWAYSTNYWTKEGIDSNNLYAVTRENALIPTNYDNYEIGLRPIVIIHESQISNMQ